MLTANEKATLRELALRYANYAALPIHAEKAKLWEALNTGHMMRPMVLLTVMMRDCILTSAHFRAHTSPILMPVQSAIITPIF